MKNRLIIFVLTISAAMAFAGCKSDRETTARPTTTAPSGDPQLRVRSDGYALLHSLLKKQADIDQALTMRKTDADLAATIKSIAAVSRSGATQIEAFAASDPAIQLNAQNLPKIEATTRDTIEQAETKTLLSNTFNNDVFLFRLLLTQTNALQYGDHLARAISQIEPDPARKAAVDAIAKQYHDLNDKVISFLTLKAAKP